MHRVAKGEHAVEERAVKGGKLAAAGFAKSRGLQALGAVHLFGNRVDQFAEVDMVFEARPEAVLAGGAQWGFLC